MRTPRKPRWRADLSVSLVLAFALTLSACSGDAKDSADPAAPSGSASGEAGAPEIVTQTQLGAIAGRVPKAQRQTLLDDVTAIAEDYTDWAYLGGDYPRTDWEFPVPNFSERASRRLQRDLTLATNAEIGSSIESVTPVSRKVRVDVLSPKGEPAAATARFAVVFTTSGDAGEQEVTAKGRLLLVPDGSGWQVVGHYFGQGAGR
jgi:hypothetical protein